MTTTLPLIEKSTGADGRVAAAAGRLASMIPVSFVVAGALTGTTAAVAPPSMLNWTSADVDHLEPAPAWAARNLTRDASGRVPTAPQVLLDGIKHDTGLTWGQIAEAMGVEVRTLHLWRNGGGISAAHEARLHDLAFLIQSVRLHEPTDARSELVSAQSGQSLLAQFRHGASGRDLALAAPWRNGACEALARNVAARANGEAVDEDFGFLLYATEAAARAFSTHAGAVLDDPSTTRLDWESEIDRQFASTHQPTVVDVAETSDPHVVGVHDEAGRLQAEPLFGLDDLGITLGVGAIASRPLVSQEQ